MPCPRCGDICACASAASVASSELIPTQEAISPSETATIKPIEPVEDLTASDDLAPWRQEVADRLNRYQSRRKPRPPRYPSLRLPFEKETTEETSNRVSPEPSDVRRLPASNHALALDSVPAVFVPQPTRSQTTPQPEEIPPSCGAQRASHSFSDNGSSPVTAKIIEFPRWSPPVVSPDQLADPVIDRPRILEAPELVPPPPALGGITIESASSPVYEKRPGIDIPLQSAPLARRMLSALIDDVIIAAACTLFAVIFWKVAGVRPPRYQGFAVLAGLALLLWAAYQYLLVVYTGATPGIRLARLELRCFDEKKPPRGLRRWRVLASLLSAVSLGMGYLWVFLDEDSLCWHDRITHTYLAPTGSRSAPTAG